MELLGIAEGRKSEARGTGVFVNPGPFSQLKNASLPPLSRLYLRI